MALLDLWKSSPDQLLNKSLHQLISFAGSGRLKDDSKCSNELRAFLAFVSSDSLQSYAEQCLTEPFNESGLALQDVVNEIGSRLGAIVQAGLYRGRKNQSGHDGIWTFPNRHSLVVEMKTTDTYRINLNVLARYRQQLAEAGVIDGKQSSILLVVGREDTGDMEAQIRGSRFAWDIRLISVDALLRLLSTKEEVDDPRIIQRIHDILIPREFTRLDEIVDVIFSTAEEIKQESDIQSADQRGMATTSGKAPKFTPVAFHEGCIRRIEARLSEKLVKRSRARYSTPNESVTVICAVSKEHGSSNTPSYWFAFHEHQRQLLKESPKGYVAFGCGSEERVLLIPFPEFARWLGGMSKTINEDREYSHVQISREGEQYLLRRKAGQKLISLDSYLLSEGRP